MIDKDKAHKTLRGLNFMTCSQPDINRSVADLKEYVLALEAKPEAEASLRDAFAIAALQGDWASQDEATGCWENEDTPMHTAALEDRAALYYRMADAMLRARTRS